MKSCATVRITTAIPWMAWLLCACSSSGETGSEAAPGTGATAQVGGTSNSGGSVSHGGGGGNAGMTTAATSGGKAPAGGAVSGGNATGGTSSTGGALSGGATGSGGAPSGGTTGSGGALSGGTTGSGGRTGMGGRTGGGGTTGSGGALSGGTTGSGGALSGGMAGSGGALSGGTAGSGGATSVSGDDYVSDVEVTVHPDVKTVLVVTWTQLKAADNTLLEFGFSGKSDLKSRAQAGATGAHRDVVLGVPEKTEVSLRIVSTLGGVDHKTKDYEGTTGAIPSGMPRPTFVSYDASLASPDPWVLGSVEDSAGGCPDLSCYYDGGLFWIFILDRQGRVVWYWADPASNASSAYPRVARDGEYIVIDKAKAGMTHSGATGVVKMTLDHEYDETIAIDGIDDAIDVTTDGSILYDTTGDLHEHTKDGKDRIIWSCKSQFPEGGGFLDCYSNTVNWVPADDTVMLSFPYIDTVVQIDRQSGKLVGQYGNSSGSYAFSPSPWKLQFQHSATITPQGTLLVSSHLPDYPDGTAPGPKHHAFEEFEIDHANKTLTQKWIYSDGNEWATFKGYNLRLANGNTLVNYGSGGVIRELTPDKKTAFEVSFLVTPGDGFNNKMVGNTVPVADLYALNGGGPR
jgi:hypothetical protein